MPKLVKDNLLLFVILIGGLLFLTTAVCIVGILLVRSPGIENAEVIADTALVSDSPAPVDNMPTVPDDVNDQGPLPPTATAEPTNTTELDVKPTATGASAAEDKLSLPTATPTPSPIPVPTNTPTPLPPTPVPKPVEGSWIGNVAPDFTLGSNRASRVSLSDLRGKIVILNFWTTWCPACRHEVPNLQAIHNEFGPRGVVVLAVNLGEKLENVERFAHDNGVSFTVWLDEDKWAGNIYGVRSIPTTYFIDEEGVIRDIQIGTMNREQIIARLEKLL